MKVIKLLFIIIIPAFVFSQNSKTACTCPVNKFGETKADTTFRLSNHISMVLCGSRELEVIKGKILYREFILSECGSNKIIKFWGAVELCDVKVKKDTLLVKTLVNLPVGQLMNYNYTVWVIERIYLFKGKIIRDSLINPQLPKYSPSQIAHVLNLYYRTSDQNGDRTGELMDKLLISALSGSHKAKYYLDHFPKKFKTLSGIYFEQYDDDIRMLKLWESKHRE